MATTPFAEVVEALLAIQACARPDAAAAAEEEEGEGKRRERVEELLVGLFRAHGRDQDALWGLLRLLLPQEDRDSVYGMKTRRLMRAMADALRKAGCAPEAATLRAWTPSPCRSRLVRGAIVSAPE
ncbi:MAG TPA: hypothetical protein HPQ04_15470, partial [Rhodospirillaceae bacterium]|nr:hypothetical protein [Rhodospirillaceae bacterium]